MNSQTKTKETLNMNHLQCSPVHRSIKNSIDNIGQSPINTKSGITTLTTNIKNKSLKTAQSPERKTERQTGNILDNIAKNNNLTTISHGERNMVPRSISPIVNIGNFNNTTNSLKDGQNSNSNNNNITASPNHNGNNDKSTIDRNSTRNERKTINNPQKLNPKQIPINTNKKTSDINSIKKLANNSSNTSSTTNSTNVTPNQVQKQPPSYVPMIIDIKKDKIVLNTIVETEKKNVNKTSLFVDKKKNTNAVVEKKNNVTENKINNNSNFFNQKLPEKLSSEKLIGDKTKKDIAPNKPAQSNNVINKLKNSSNKDKSEDNEIENLVQKKQSEFACCTINDFNEILTKLSKYCEESNVLFKDVNKLF